MAYFFPLFSSVDHSSYEKAERLRVLEAGLLFGKSAQLGEDMTDNWESLFW